MERDGQGLNPTGEVIRRLFLIVAPCVNSMTSGLPAWQSQFNGKDVMDMKLFLV
jgi:hypothetical protein